MKRLTTIQKLPLFAGRISLPLFFFLISFASRAQSEGVFYFPAIAEKIYLQLDNKAYTTSQTIWFKAVVAEAAQHIPSKLSGVLYVELIAPDQRTVDKKLIRIINGTGDGSFELNPEYADGTYMIRAYTEWNKNFGSEFFFKEYVQIFSSSGNPGKNPVREVTVIEEQNKQRYIKAVFDPLMIDSSHTKDLKLFLYLDEKKDSISIRKSSTGIYSLEYPVPDGCQFVTFQLETKNNLSYSRSIILEKDYVDLQFFPEGGEMVNGIPCLLGFKALDSVGKGKSVSGEIINNKQEVIAIFKSNRLGMGTVRLPFPDSAERYMARITSGNSTIKKLYALPRAVAKGNAIAVAKSGDKIWLKVSSSYLLSDSLSVLAACRGIVYFNVKGRMKEGNLDFGLPAASLPEGVIAFTIVDDSLNPMAERLYFNERPDTRLSLSLSADKETYQQREQTQLEIMVRDSEGKAVNANMSVLVMNVDQHATEQEQRSNILSYMLVSSDLKGRIEDPGFYFGNDPHRAEALNALLLTQGWRKYNYTRLTGNITIQPEYTLTVSGSVTGGLFNTKQKKGTSLTMMTFGKPPSVDVQVSDSLGRFSFPVNDQYQGSVNVVIQTSNKSGAKKDYTINLDKKTVPEIEFDHVRSVESPDSTVQAYVQQSISNKKILDAYIARTEGVTLGEVIVKSRVLTPERKKMIDKYGEPKRIIDGDDIRSKEAKWSYGLYSVLLFNFPDKIRIVRMRDGTLYARCLNSEVTLVVIDGIPVQEYDYQLIPAIPPSEVKSFEVIEYAKNFSQLFCEVFPRNCADPPVWGNVIAIYTYGRNGIFGANRAPGITKAAIPVFSAPKEFYSPKYDQLKKEDWLKPDLRTLIHWQPQVDADSTGRAKVSFYNADLTGKTQVIVEAISSGGEIGYQQLFFNVVKRKEEK